MYLISICNYVTYSLYYVPYLQSRLPEDSQRLVACQFQLVAPRITGREDLGMPCAKEMLAKRKTPRFGLRKNDHGSDPKRQCGKSFSRIAVKLSSNWKGARIIFQKVRIPDSIVKADENSQGQK